jgi:enoyl-CoA hydratase/carnithine racemase
VLVSPNARFTPYYAVVGFSPDGGWTAILPWLIGQRRAADILYHNHSITAEQAVAWGIANEVVPAGRIHAAAFNAARDIADKRGGALEHTKQLLVGGYDDLAARLERERAHFVAQIGTAEARQGISEFMAGQYKRGGKT